MPGAPSATASAGGRALRRIASFAVVFLVVAAALAAALAPHLLPDTLARRDAGTFAAVVVFAGSYLALALGKIPFLAIDRAGVALVGACLMVVAGALPLADAYKAVDLDTLTLLLGMMIVVANLRLSGFFAHRHRLGDAARAPAVGAAGRGGRGRRRVLGVPGERRDLPRAVAAGARPHAGAEAAADAVSAGGGDGVQCRLDRDHHRQSAEHHDRQVLAHPLCALRRRAGAGGAGRAAADGGADRAGPSRRVFRQRDAAAGRAAAGARQPRPGRARAGGDAGDGRAVLRRRQRRPRRRSSSAGCCC